MPDQKQKSILRLDPAMGMSGDIFVAALLDLGAPRREMLAAMKAVGEIFGALDIHTHLQFLPDAAPARQLHIHWLADTKPAYIPRQKASLSAAKTGLGMGQPKLDRPDVLRVFIVDSQA